VMPFMLLLDDMNFVWYGNCVGHQWINTNNINKMGITERDFKRLVHNI
jgi:quinolinate synthase